ncbi:transcriptional regulator with XRE-family HTH domain [Variovorax paradoxus]|uniref:helix-turn-helix domain-containing protein n=1 Tax=Variovorax TaxID=34072 RepID=UPI00119D0D3B|nr:MULTISPECIES: helix-turn-helix transcriptional regulator [Variovorax]MBD9663212.1 helix-turn-helix transcriptional regulator [Variovorax sp. VRV01]MDP9962992.1 transcriptional regulator with XRE-family HTH domain [Variovorax paradoxus]
MISLSVRFGKRLRELRKERGLSQEDFAARCGLDRTYVSGMERGVRNPSLAVIDTLAVALGIRLEELFKGL